MVRTKNAANAHECPEDGSPCEGCDNPPYGQWRLSNPQPPTMAEASTPAVPSPLNPDAAASRARRPAVPREQREKKESLKKREAKGTDSLRDGTPDSQGHGRKSKKQPETSVLSPTRYPLPAPKPADFDPPLAPVLTPTITVNEVQFNQTSEHVFNRKGYRYTPCIADPEFPASRYYRQTETAPYEARMDFEDCSSQVLFDQSAKIISTEKGWRMGRANVGVREGTWYYEAKIVNGVKRRALRGPSVGPDDWGHVRCGFARREASPEGPVGVDAYGYSIRDFSGEKVHLSRPKEFLPKGESVYEGDVLGFEIHLPSLQLHKKVVDGSYNKAVDVTGDIDPSNVEASDVIRDRVPIRYKGHVYFESQDYHPTKELEDLMSPAPIITSTTAATTVAPHPNHPQVTMRTLPSSYIKVYINGRLMGTPFTDLLAFLPPASKPSNQSGAREGLDDGMVGYFPTVSVFRKGAAEVNFGPDFWFPPPELPDLQKQKFKVSAPANATNTTDKDDKEEDVDMITTPEDDNNASPEINKSNSILGYRDPNRTRGMRERYNEQIAEDLVYDIIDEVCFLQEDGWPEPQVEDPSAITSSSAVVDSGAADITAHGHGLGNSMMSGESEGSGAPAGEIKEIVQEEE